MAFKRLEKLVKFLNAGSCNSGLFIVNANFKILLTCLSSLLNLEAWYARSWNFKICLTFYYTKRMQCEAQLHALWTCEGFRGFKKGDKGTAS